MGPQRPSWTHGGHIGVSWMDSWRTSEMDPQRPPKSCGGHIGVSWTDGDLENMRDGPTGGSPRTHRGHGGPMEVMVDA